MLLVSLVSSTPKMSLSSAQATADEPQIAAVPTTREIGSQFRRQCVALILADSPDAINVNEESVGDRILGLTSMALNRLVNIQEGVRKYLFIYI